MEAERGPAGGQVGDLEILPPYSTPPAGSDGFHACFLRCEPGGIPFIPRGTAASLDVGDLRRRIDTTDKAIAEACDCAADAAHFGDVDARPDDQDTTPASRTGGRMAVTPI